MFYQAHVFFYEFLKFIGQNRILILFLKFNERSLRPLDFLLTFFISHFFESFYSVCPVEDIWAVFTVGPPHTLSLLWIINGLVVDFAIWIPRRRIARIEKTIPTKVITILVIVDDCSVELTIVYLEFIITDLPTLVALSTSTKHPLTLGYLVHHGHFLPTKGSCNWHLGAI